MKIAGNILTLNENGGLDYLTDSEILIDRDGKIKEIRKSKNSESNHCEKLILPGLIDSHVHLPQMPAIGIGKDQLLEWLEKLIFPIEKNFKDPEYAAKISEAFFAELIAHGTTSAAVYCSSHPSATKIAIEKADNTGINALIGMSLADQAPNSDEIHKILNDVSDLIKFSEKFSSVNFILTPRFAGNCSMDLMTEISKIAKSKNLPIQTHLAENREELQLIASRFPTCTDYTEVYEKADLLGNRTILAHCIYLSDREISALQGSGCHIAHCPVSNRFLKSGMMNFRKLSEQGLNITLGTDIAGGSSFSILNEMREAIENSKTLSFLQNDPKLEISAVEAFHAATIGGAKALGLDKTKGIISTGFDADLIVLDGKIPAIKYSSAKTPEEILSAVIYNYSNKKVEEVFIRGKKKV